MVWPLLETPKSQFCCLLGGAVTAAAAPAFADAHIPIVQPLGSYTQHPHREIGANLHYIRVIRPSSSELTISLVAAPNGTTVNADSTGSKI